MAVTNRIKNELWGNAGGICSFPDCNKRLSENGNNIGQICHIIARSQSGPRGDFEIDNVDSYDNLILLCQEHHKFIDDHPQQYTVDILRGYKKNHELTVRHKLNFANNFYSNLLRELESRVISLTFNWLESLPQVDWSLKTDEYEKLYSLIEWINSRDWVEDNDLKLELQNLASNVERALNTFELHMTEPRNGYYFIDKFYKRIDYYSNPQRREALQKEFDNHTIDLINLTIDIARNFNTVFRIIRRDIDSNFLSELGIIPTLHGTNVA